MCELMETVKNRVVPKDALMDAVADKLASGREVTILAAGISMMPLIRPNDLITFASPRGISIGDIVLAKRQPDGEYVAHRIAEIRRHSVTLRGDGNLHGREMALKRDISGVLIRVSRGGRDFDPRTPWQKYKAKFVPPLYRLGLRLRSKLSQIYRRVFVSLK